MFGLDGDPQLRRQVLMALKRSPASAIIVDGRCIYRGGETNLTSNSARAVARTRDERSLSPSRPRAKRSRSPPEIPRHQEYSEYRDRSPQRGYDEYRTRSPVGRHTARPTSRDRYRYTRSRSASAATHRGRPDSCSPLPEPRHLEHRWASLRHASGSNAVTIATPKISSTQPSQDLMPPILSMAQLETLSVKPQSVSKLVADPKKDVTKSSFDRVKLGDMTNVARPSPQPREVLVDDPHFVLGVGRGATEAEILDTFNQRIAEVETERLADTGFVLYTPGTESIYEESIRMLKAAKSQLLGR
ncbi:hypothetical protein BP5796_11245 [Coleophoma crateriformis]|uniref:Uncharacterized protein n=1 Tax=Coleophoma crateriformis TaxID=565419 RepID=A0A3D8QHM8_9HELO|nr:hypothetical protein BP5796_11245 [Coleophoma crateriformis]